MRFAPHSTEPGSDWGNAERVSRSPHFRDYFARRGGSWRAVEAGCPIPPEKHAYRYAEGKWTIKEVLMHIIDTERVFAYRAVAAARGDVTPVYRMDEELYARNVDVSNRTIGDLISEFKTVRNATEFLFKNMTDEQSKRSCNVVTHPMSARAIGYFIIAHVLHHIGVLRARYLP